MIWSLSHCSAHQPNEAHTSQYANYKDFSFCVCSYWGGNLWCIAFANSVSIDLLLLFKIVMDCTVYSIAKGTTPLSVKTLPERREKPWCKMTVTKDLLMTLWALLFLCIQMVSGLSLEAFYSVVLFMSHHKNAPPQTNYSFKIYLLPYCCLTIQYFTCLIHSYIMLFQHGACEVMGRTSDPGK